MFDGQLNAALNPEFGDECTAQVEQITGDETFALTVDTPPQVSRHKGYETAFFDLPNTTIDVSKRRTDGTTKAGVI